ncbi:MAG: phosphatase PAP2 family protein [Chloroflexota bacterium]
MGDPEIRNSSDTVAKIISVVFHPLFMPVYGMAIILSALTPFGYLPFTVKKLIFLIIGVNNVFLPLMLLPFLMQMKLISSWTLAERKERYIPLVITTLLYAATSYIVFRFPIPFFIKAFIFSTFFLSLFVTIINFSFRISLHAAGAGALFGLLLLLCFRSYTFAGWHFVLVAIAAGMILTSRLKLNVHTPQQVWWGFFTGFMVVLIFMSFFQHFA